MVVDFEYEIHEVVYFILINNRSNQAYVNKGSVEEFEVSLVNFKPVKKIKLLDISRVFL